MSETIHIVREGQKREGGRGAKGKSKEKEEMLRRAGKVSLVW